MSSSHDGVTETLPIIPKTYDTTSKKSVFSVCIARRRLCLKNSILRANNWAIRSEFLNKIKKFFF